MNRKAISFKLSLEDAIELAPWVLLLLATLADIGLAITAELQLAQCSFLALSAGLVGGVMVTLFDVGRWLDRRRRLPFRWAELLLIATNVTVLGIYGWAWLERQHMAMNVPTARSLMAELVAMSIAGLGGWLAQELVGPLHGLHSLRSNKTLPQARAGAVFSSRWLPRVGP